MKKFILYILIVCIPVLSACGDVNIYRAHSEPEDLAVIKTVGIDYENGIIELTATTGIGADGISAKTYSSKADTLAEAVNGIQNGYLGDEAYFSHVQQIIIGEAAAKNGITEILDYVGRNVYMRLSTKLYLVKGGNAKKLIEETTGESISAPDMLEAISKKSEFMAAGTVFTCKVYIDIIDFDDFHTAAAYGNAADKLGTAFAVMHDNICCIRMKTGSGVVFCEAEFQSLLLCDGKGITNSYIVRSKAENTAKKR